MALVFENVRDAPHLSCESLAGYIRCKPYVLNQLIAKLVFQNKMSSPCEYQGGKFIALESFKVVAQHLSVSDDVYDSIVLGFEQAKSR